MKAQLFWLSMRHSDGQYSLHTYLQGCSRFIRLQFEIFYRLSVICVVVCSFLFIDWQSSAVWVCQSLLNYSSIAGRVGGT